MPHRHPRSVLFRQGMTLASLIVLSACTLLLSSCGNFFSCEGKADCPCASGVTSTTTNPCSGGSGSGSGSTNDYVYVSNSSTSDTYLNGYTPSSSALTATTSSPYSLGIVPSAIAITPSNSFIYISSESSTGSVYGYTIATGGQPSIIDSGTPLINDNVQSMDVSPDGKWLFVLDASPAQEVEIYSINSSTGILTFSTDVLLAGSPNGVYSPLTVKFSPSGEFVVCTLGTGGADVFSFDTTTGIPGTANLITPGTSATGIYAATWDASNYLYTAGTAGLQVFSVNTSGGPSLLNTYTIGNGPRSILVNSTSTDIYVGNQTDGTITAYAIGTNGALTSVTGSPFTGPTSVSALATDSTGDYLIAAGFNTSTGVQLFTIGSTGALTLDATAASGTTAPVVAIAATH